MTMRKAGLFVVLAAMAALVACGGSDPAQDAFQPAQPTTPVTPTAQAASITVVTDSPTVPSDGATPANLTAFVRNAQNQFMSGVQVTFSSSSGGLAVTQATTDGNGVAKATLTPAGDPSSRTITVTATAGTVNDTVDVVVGGSSLTLQGPGALVSGQTATYTVLLNDAGNKAISGAPVTIASARSNTLSATTVTTNAQGQATFTVTASQSGNDTITVRSLGLAATQAVAVNSDSFSFTTPAANTEIALGAVQRVTVRWTRSGAAVANTAVSFSTTRGTVTPVSATTDSSGNIQADISAANAGAGVITASGAGGATTQLTVEYVATNPTRIEVQPSVFTIGTGQTSTLTATVRDTAGNLVKNQPVVFTLVDVTGGTLSTGTAVTNSQGQAQSIYRAGSTVSANEGVEITATVQSTSVFDKVRLTVARREVFISLGTGNQILKVNPLGSQYKIEYAVQVTDADGSGVANVPVSMRVLSRRYYKGFRIPPDATAVPPTTVWTDVYTIDTTPSGGIRSSSAGGCADEDVNRNGILDVGEDNNSSLQLEAGNIATVTPAAVTTDANGFAIVNVFYPAEYAKWLRVDLAASATVQGSEYVRTQNFLLPIATEDITNANTTPPGGTSPFGVGNSCGNTQ